MLSSESVVVMHHDGNDEHSPHTGRSMTEAVIPSYTDAVSNAEPSDVSIESLVWRITWIRAFPIHAVALVAVAHAVTVPLSSLETTTVDGNLKNTAKATLSWSGDSLWSESLPTHGGDDSWETLWQQLRLRVLWHSEPLWAHNPHGIGSTLRTTATRHDDIKSTALLPNHCARDCFAPLPVAWPQSTGYGEISDAAIIDIIMYAHGKRYTNWPGMTAGDDSMSMAQSNRTRHGPLHIVDLGSGSGRVLISACLIHQHLHQLDPPEPESSTAISTGQHQPSSINRQAAYGLGYEVVLSRHQQAMDHLYQLQRRMLLPNHRSISHENTTSCSLDALTEANALSITFACADFTVDTSWVSRADWVWIHATVFEPALMALISTLCQACRPGTIFVVISKPLSLIPVNITDDVANHFDDAFVTLGVLRLPMDWGQADVYLQQRR